MEQLKVSFLLFHLMLFTSCADLHYKSKVVSSSQDDLFGWSLDSHKGTIIVGAPFDNDAEGSVTLVKNGVTFKIEPHQGI